MKIVLVEWTDTVFDHDSRALATPEIPEPKTLFTVGFLIAANPDHISIAMEEIAGLWRDIKSIPLGCVKQIKQVDAARFRLLRKSKQY